MCIHCGQNNCFDKCGCLGDDNETILNEIERDYKGGFISEVQAKKQAQEFLNDDDYIKFLDDLGIE